jgi:acid-sensing ion channel, other
MSLFRYIPRALGPRSLDENHHSSSTFLGVNYFFHSPYEMFTKNSKHFQSSPSNALIMYIDPQLTLIEDALKDYPPERRGCYLQNEKPLRYFKKFTKGNCRSECLINSTLQKCGCVQFFMIRDLETRVCGINDMMCYRQVEDSLQRDNLCSCYLECGEIVYSLSVHRMEFTKYMKLLEQA